MLVVVAYVLTPAAVGGVPTALIVLNRSFGVAILLVVGALGRTFVLNRLATERQAWIRAGQAELAEQMQGELGADELCGRVLESSADRIDVLDRSGVLVLRRGASGAQLDATIGANWMAQWHPESREAAAQAVEAAGTGRVSRFTAMRLDDERGDTYWDVSVSAIRDAAGAVDKLLAISRDVTARKQAEDERVGLLEELQGLLRSNELFVAILGHDLRSPLTAVATGARLLASASDDALVQRTAGRILNSSVRMPR